MAMVTIKGDKMRQKITFVSDENTLSGLLEGPDINVKFYALFAHCFTCGKDVAAASRITRALAASGVAVLRFDFTGLGNSDGDFANTNFSSNINDLVAAANFLREMYQAPKLLIGHSLGGAAVLAAADKVPESSAIVTIGSPASAAHVARNFAAHIDDIEKDGCADVSLGGRKFTIKRQFLQDINQQSMKKVNRLNKPILILHSPADSIVNITEAEKIYHSALHPKSFVSLDKADHLLSSKIDSEYAADVIVAWAMRYISVNAEKRTSKGSGWQVLVEEKDHKFAQHVSTTSHYWLADEPVSVGGSNVGPDPYEHLLAGLGACTAMTLRMYAKRKNLPIEHIKVSLTHRRDYKSDCSDVENQEGIEAIVRNISYRGELDALQQARFLEIADLCPVHKTLHNHVTIVSKLC